MRRLSLLILLIVLSLTSASAQQEPGLLGSWQAKDGELVIRLILNPDGTGTLDEAPIKYQVRGAKLIVDEAGTINNYTFKLDGGVLVVSGGDLDSPLTFTRAGSGRGLGGHKSQAAVGKQNSETEPKEKGLVGRWQSSEATVQINDNGTLVLNGETLRYSVKANIITLANNDGAVQLPFQLSGDTLRVQVGERTVVYKRLTGEQGSEAVGPAAGANPPRVIR